MEQIAYTEMSDTEDRHWWFVARRKILSNKIKSFDLPANAKILEIGVGTGGNLEMLARFGSVQGVEMNPEAIKLANHKTGDRFDIQRGKCPDGLPKFKDKFDLICMFDVLEHIEEDVETLARIKDLLAKHGTLFITVPAYQWMWSKHDDHLFHKRRYTAPSLRDEAKATGWKTTYSSYFNSLLFPLIALIRIKDKFTRSDKIVGHEVPGSFLNGVLKHIFGLEAGMLKWIKFPFGTSIIATFKHADNAAETS